MLQLRQIGINTRLDGAEGLLTWSRQRQGVTNDPDEFCCDSSIDARGIVGFLARSVASLRR